MTALHTAAAEARVRDAELWAVLAWQPPGGEIGSRNGCGPSDPAEHRAAAVERLRDVLATAFGTAGPGVALAGLTVRGTPGAALVGVDHQEKPVRVRAQVSAGGGLGRGRGDVVGEPPGFRADEPCRLVDDVYRIRHEATNEIQVITEEEIRSGPEGNE
ncbi:hypothetical protein ACWDXD_27465 [Streptomyces sp. NPDC003314]